MELDAAPMTFNFYLFLFSFFFILVILVFMCSFCMCACVFLNNLGSKVEPWGSRRAERILLIVFFFLSVLQHSQWWSFPLPIPAMFNLQVMK